MSEDAIQIALVQWFDLQYPDAAPWLYHSPAGGVRNKVTAWRLKAMGARRGFPDLTLWLPRGGFHGLAVELKAGRNKMTPEQADWLAHMSSAGWMVACCVGFDAARDTFASYLALEGK